MYSKKCTVKYFAYSLSYYIVQLISSFFITGGYFPGNFLGRLSFSVRSVCDPVTGAQWSPESSHICNHVAIIQASLYPRLTVDWY